MTSLPFCAESDEKSIAWAIADGVRKNLKISLYNGPLYDILIVAFLSGLGKAPTFLVPIINPPFADNSPHFPSPGILVSGISVEG
jgi:hypothetical protein